MRGGTRAGLTKIEIVAIAAILVVALAVIQVMRSSPRLPVMSYKDQRQIASIANALFVGARENNDVFPTPGLAKRLPVDGRYIPGRGEEDITQNTTANLFSFLIMGNFITPALCIGPTEPSDHLQMFDTYNYEGYSSELVWDRNFKANLHNISNVSYAHLTIFGETNRSQWRDTLAGDHILLGNRGPLGGEPDPNSITNEFHPPKDSWTGNIAFGDGHVEFLRVFPTVARPNDLSYIIAPECIPKSGVIPATDAAITFTKEMTAVGPVIQHD